MHHNTFTPTTNDFTAADMASQAADSFRAGQEASYSAADMASASAQGFRDGYASAKRGDPAPLPNDSDDFELPAKARETRSMSHISFCEIEE